LRLNLLKHRLTPAIWYTLWLPGLRTFELDNLLASRQLGYQQKELVRQENRKRSGRTDF
jgi:hypothetical protein